jgi:hypothetical protein
MKLFGGTTHSDITAWLDQMTSHFDDRVWSLTDMTSTNDKDIYTRYCNMDTSELYAVCSTKLLSLGPVKFGSESDAGMSLKLSRSAPRTPPPDCQYISPSWPIKTLAQTRNALAHQSNGSDRGVLGCQTKHCTRVEGSGWRLRLEMG